MNKFKFLMIVCLLGIASTVSAQFVNTNSSSMNSSSSDVSSWSGLRVSYHPVSIEDLDLTGASIGYVKSFSISNGTPIFVETGANVSWVGGTVFEEPEDYEDIKLNVFSVNVPINLGYKLAFSNTASIFPFVGLTLRGNVVGNYSCDGESTNAFDDELEFLKLKRFQIGWQVGVGANFNKLYIGASYGTDFSEILEDCKATMPSLTIGFNF